MILLKKFPDGAYLPGGYRSPIPDFASRGRKRGTCTRGRRCREECRGATVSYGWPGSGGGGAGARAAGCHRRGDGGATGRPRSEGNCGRRP